VTFSEPIANGNIGSLGGLTATSFSGLGTNTLTWNFNPIPQGSFNAVLAGSGTNAVTDAAGHSLGGTGFTKSFKVLWGDYSDDGSVMFSDVNAITKLATGAFPFTVFGDLNGDGVIDAKDVAIVQARLYTTQP
jgi:hypothetical protein